MALILDGISKFFPPQNPTCRPPPHANPDDPGLTRSTSVEKGPNGFALGIEGPDPNLATGGTHDQQEAQRDTTVALALAALGSYTTGHTGLPRTPSDANVATILTRLDTNPPIGEDGDEVTRGVYQSEIPNLTAEQGYEHFVGNPNEVFNAGGMEIRPPTDRLVDGGRYMLEIGTPVPTWLPVEIRLNPAGNAVTINTLDGHVLRGEQTFTFTDDCNGGTVLTQDARFQASSVLPEEIQQIASIADGQHATWQEAHREIYEQANGDRDYQGIGTDFSASALLAAWGEALGNVVADPGNAADTGIDIAGEFGNWGLDLQGDIVEEAFDLLGIPGGGVIGNAYDTVGDWVSSAADVAGDVTEAVIDAPGNAVDWVRDRWF